MTVKDFEKSCRCKYAKWAKNGKESTTVWLECNLKNTITDPASCAKCAEREQMKGK